MKKILRILPAAVLSVTLTISVFAEAKAVNDQNYSAWAYPELEKAEPCRFITDRIRGDMRTNATREKFAELMAFLGSSFYDLTGNKMGC